MQVKAAVCREFGKPLSIETLELAPPRRGEVLVDLKACAICHSDISYAEGAWGGDLPAVYGHEAAGEVSAIGSGVTGVVPGDHVIVTLIRSCGQCHYCARESLVMCEEVFPFDKQGPLTLTNGVACEQGLRTGAFAEKVVVHESQLAHIPPEMPFDVASLLACGVITGFGAVVNTARVSEGQSVAVIGCGGVGLNAIQGAALAGANPIIALDLSSDKQTASRSFGATHTFNPTDPDHGKAIKTLTEGRGVDFVFVTVGVEAALVSASRYITRNGSIIVVGMPSNGVRIPYDPGKLAAFNQKIIGSKMGETRLRHDIPILVEHYQKGRLKLDELITARYRLEDINEAIAAVNNGQALRNVLVFK
ncbi:Zn-dependent alcohol dehydrogenase [Nitratireductor kimnyeongensis]|uniref:Zn-dependent alcohol dehydrogenase n=1 Tax=Nitratireductor kimnyeongensis TaxID=430679 RepID=A0ABW0T8C2_9HYPH|nr:Zn-dependent alcohol dehydrogenase [Nitratireductor kimnyeongensis]QZZ36050.1 Zn-dependent alcohol dehydrogenase [Nitratireductor kimnyeongensis]